MKLSNSLLYQRVNFVHHDVEWREHFHVFDTVFVKWRNLIGYTTRYLFLNRLSL